MLPRIIVCILQTTYTGYAAVLGLLVFPRRILIGMISGPGEGRADGRWGGVYSHFVVDEGLHSGGVLESVTFPSGLFGCLPNYSHD